MITIPKDLAATAVPKAASPPPEFLLMAQAVQASFQTKEKPDGNR